MARKGKKGRRTKSNKSAFGMLKGGIYVAAFAAPGYDTYEKAGGGKAGAAATAKGYAGIGAATNEFDMPTLAKHYTPVAVVAVTDLVTTKLGIQRRIARGINGILR